MAERYSIYVSSLPSLPHQLQLLFSQVAWGHCDLPASTTVLSLRRGRRGKGTDTDPAFLVVECWVKGFLNYFLLSVELPHW